MTVKRGGFINVLFDYLTISFEDVKLASILEILCLNESDFIETRSYFKYNYCLYFSGIKIHLNNRYSLSVNQSNDLGGGCCLDLSGVGCRTIESAYNYQGLVLDWHFFLLKLYCLSEVSVSRIDVACDDKQGILNFNKMIHHCEKKKYICKSKYLYQRGYETGIYFGKPASERRLRIYDKALERGVKEHWIRVEFQLRDEAAQSFINNLFKYIDVGNTYYGILIGFLRFTTKPYELKDHVHISRFVVTKWWKRFTKGLKKIKCYHIGGLEYNLQRNERFLTMNAASNMKFNMLANGGDLTYLLTCATTAKLNVKQKNALTKMGFDYDDGDEELRQIMKDLCKLTSEQRKQLAEQTKKLLEDV